MLIGYIRTSTGEQDPSLQRDALLGSGCERLFEEVASGAKELREQLQAALDFARPGDTLVVWRLDRLARSLKHLIQIIGTLNDRGVGLQSLHENIDTTTSGGKLIFHIFGALAEFERELIRERTSAGLEAARKRGRKGGRPAKMDTKKTVMAQKLLSNPDTSIADVSTALGVSRETLYRHLRRFKAGL
jgi:DNA invertase Pin-like site-specific DNA recombinase